MTWQEELRRLDAELARGGITHDQHRKLRDELLAAVSGGGTASPVAAPLSRPENGKDGKTGTDAGWQSTNPGYGSTPEPAPKPEPEPEPEPTPEAVADARRQTAAALLTTARPTTAPSPADHRPTDSMPYPRAIVPSVRPTMPTRGGIQPVPPDLTPEETTATLRLDLDAGPPADRPTGNRPTWLFLALGVLLVLVMIIGGAWWLGQDGDPPSGDQAAPPPPTPTEPSAVALEDRLPKLPGKSNPANSTMSVDRGVELRLYSAEDATKMKNAGATEVIYRNSSDEAKVSNGYTVLVVRTPSSDHASLLAQGMRKSLADLGFAGTPSGNDPDDTTLTGSNPDGRLSVTWYASGNAAVGVGVSQSLDDDPGELRQRLEFTLASVATALPRR